MTVSTEIVTHSYFPGSAMVDEAIPFQFLDADDIAVSIGNSGAPLVAGTDYIITGNGGAGSAKIRALRVFADDEKIVLWRETRKKQDVVADPFQPLPAAALERGLDRRTLVEQEIGADISRALIMPRGENGGELPSADVRAGRALSFDLHGDPTVYIPFGNEDKADRLDVVPVNFLKFVSRTKWSSILDGTLVGNLNDEWDAFRASGEKAVLMPEGLCPFDLDGWSMMAEQQGMTLLGYGRTRSKIKNIKATGIAARPLLISTGDSFTMRGLDMLHNALELTQPTMANNSIPMGSTVMLMGNNFLVEDCGGQDSWDNIYSAGKIDLETGVFEPGSPGDGVFNRVLTRNGGRAIQTLLGSGVPAPQPFQSGAGINILTGGRCAVNHCRDFFSSTGFALDYGSGAQSVFNSCMGYGNKRSIGDYPSLGATPGGQAFYVGGRGIFIGCESFDGEGNSFWFDATSFDCIAVGCRSRGSQINGAVVQGYNQQIEILVEDASQAGVGQYDAIVMRGGKWEGGNLYSDSYDVVVKGQTRGDKHRYGLSIEQGTYKITGEAKGNYQGSVAAINNPDSSRVLVDARISGDEATKVIIGREVARSANNSFLDEAFGDFQGNGTLFVEDFAVPSRRIAMGIDPVNVVAILQSIWAGYSPLDLAINPSGGKVILGRGDWQFPTVINGMRLWSTAGIMYTKMTDPTGATDGAPILGGGGSVASVSGASTIPGLGLAGTVTDIGPLTLELSDSNAARTAFGVAYLEDVKAALYPLDTDHNAALAWYLANIATTVRLRGTGPYILGDANLPNGAVIEGSRAVAAIFKRAAGAKSIFKIAAANVVMRNMRFDGEAWDANGLADPARVGVSTILSGTSTTITVAAGHGARFAVGMDAFFPTDLFVGFDAHGRITDVTGDVLTFHAPIEGAPIVGGKVLADHPLIDIAEDAYAPSCQNLYLRNFVAGIRTGATVSAGNAIPGIHGCLLENYTGAGIIQREGMAGESMADVRLSPNHTVRKTTVAAGGETSVPYAWNVTPYMHRGSDGPSITVTKNGASLVYSTDYTVNPTTGMIGLVTPASPGDVFIASNNEWSRGFLFDGRSGSVNGMGTLSNAIVIGATIALDIRGGASGGVEYLNVTGGVFDSCSLACVRVNDTRGVRLTGTGMLFAPYPILIGALNRGFNAASIETTVMTSTAIRDPADRPNRAALTAVSGHTGTRIDRASWFGSNSTAGDTASIQWISDVVLLEDGTSAAPSWAYRRAPTTGCYLNASGDIVYQRSGSDKGKITDKGLRVPYGSVSEVGLGFAGSGVANADDGFFYLNGIRVGVQGGTKFFFGVSDCGTLNVPFRLTPYTVATLPTPGTAARTAFATNGRVFNGTGTLEGAGVGSGALVNDNGTAWKVAGTNVTVSA